jgi:hypothetical protein
MSSLHERARLGPDMREPSAKCKWHSIATAPFNRDLELAVQDQDGTHALVFPCQRALTGWVASKTHERLDVSPTHWRTWKDTASEIEVN